MARQARIERSKPKDDYQQKALRRGQIIMAIFSLFIILSMILSLIISL